MNNYKSFSELKEELGNNYDFKLYEMGISALKEIENLQQENKQLKSQWCKLKEYLHNVDVVIDHSENYDGRFINYDELVNKMQEIEGSDSNE
jgi:F0F1-type ATP synthase beta subunit